MELTETTKSKVCSDIKTHLLGEWKKEVKDKKLVKKVSKLMEHATEDQFRFGDPPSYERGYLSGNITATGYRDNGDAEYTRTINLDLETPEYTFFNIDKPREETLCEHACKNVSHMKNSIYTVEKRTKLYTCNDKMQALQDFARETCREKFSRIDLSLKNCRVNDATYFETESTEICHFYPVYLDTKDKKGRTKTTIIGFYNAYDDEMDYYVCPPMDAADTLVLLFQLLGWLALIGFILYQWFFS